MKISSKTKLKILNKSFLIFIALIISSCSNLLTTKEPIITNEINQLEEVIKSYNKLLLKDTKNEKLIFDRGIAQYEYGDYQGAIDDYKKLLSIKDLRKEIYLDIGLINFYSFNYKNALLNLNKVIEYANGITRNADRGNISLERMLDGTLKTIPVRNEVQFKTIIAEDGDLIYIREYPYRQARISGAVLKPGSYTMAAGETINDLIKKAGGYTENAYQFGAVYQNEDAKLINELSKEILYQEFLDNILAVSQQNVSGLDLNPIVQLTQEIKNTAVNGRVVIDLLNEGTVDLYKIKEGDELFIPETNYVVYVYGETSTEGAVMFSENKDVEYFVNKSGGYKKFADNESIYILHPNGESQLYRSKRNIFESSPQNEIKIYPGSIIFVPRALDESAPRRLAAQAYVSILGNLGIALASLSAIND